MQEASQNLTNKWNDCLLAAESGMCDEVNTYMESLISSKDIETLKHLMMFIPLNIIYYSKLYCRNGIDLESATKAILKNYEESSENGYKVMYLQVNFTEIAMIDTAALITRRYNLKEKELWKRHFFNMSNAAIVMGYGEEDRQLQMITDIKQVREMDFLNIAANSNMETEDEAKKTPVQELARLNGGRWWEVIHQQTPDQCKGIIDAITALIFDCSDREAFQMRATDTHSIVFGMLFATGADKIYHKSPQAAEVMNAVFLEAVLHIRIAFELG